MWERLWGYCTASEVRDFFKLLQIAIRSKFTFCIHFLSYQGTWVLVKESGEQITPKKKPP